MSGLDSAVASGSGSGSVGPTPPKRLHQTTQRPDDKTNSPIEKSRDDLHHHFMNFQFSVKDADLGTQCGKESNTDKWYRLYLASDSSIGTLACTRLVEFLLTM